MGGRSDIVISGVKLMPGGTLHRHRRHRPVQGDPPVFLAAELTRQATGETAIIGLALAALIGVLGGFLLTLDRRK